MDRITAAGATLTALSGVGYAVATVAPYPGRAATLPGLMVGLSLLAVGGAADHDVTESTPTDTDPAAGVSEDHAGGEG